MATITHHSEQSSVAQPIGLIGTRLIRALAENDGLRHAGYISGGLFVVLVALKLLGA